MTLYIYKNPTANAGADATVCDNQPYTLNGSATLQCGVAWNSNGDGTFNNNTLVNATYTAGLIDKQNGNVTLCLTAIPCSPCTVAATDCMTLTFIPAATAFAGNDATVCENTPFTLTGSVQNSCGNVWTTTGDGTFDNNQSLEAVYLPGADDVANGWVEICLTASACSPCTLSSSDCLILNIQKTPEVFAGSDATINSGNTFVPVDATASYYTSLLWSSAGDGVFDAPGSLHPVYTPGDNDIENISVELCLTVLPLNPCTASASDCLILSIGSIPVVSAGPDQTICEGGNYWIEFAEASNYSSLNWTTSGDGTFDFDNTLNPVYTPGPTDIQNGIADLCLTAQPIPPTTFPVTDCMSLTIQKNPVVVAGDDAVICEGQTYILNAQAENACGILWETNGDGVFENPVSPLTVYQPGDNDIAAGSVELCLTASACNPCTIPVTDCLILTIQPLASASAGEDVTICENGSASLSGTVENACGLTWSTSGDGFFDDNTSQYATYFPGTADLTNGSAELCLTAFSCNPCQDLATDCLTVFFSPEPTVALGGDVTICEDQTVSLIPSIENSCGVSWTTSGDGYFDNNLISETLYTPGPGDVEAGFVELCLTASPCAPCTQPVTECMTIFIQQLPTVSAGENMTVCEGSAVELSEATGGNYAEVIWTTTNGTGNFENENILNTIYYPGILDLLLGCVDLQVVALPINPCSTGANDNISVCFQKNPTVYAGEDALVCTDTEISLMGIIENACGSIWTTSGDGSFDNPQSANAVYTPGQDDLNTGSVELCLTAFACDLCTDDASDCIFISFQLPPTVNAGNDFTACEGSIVVLSEATAENFGSLFWMSIDGSGTFENENELNTSYYPSMTDYIQGCVTHVLMVSPINPCETGTSDDITICFQKSPYAYAGEDVAVCAGTYVNVMGTVTNSCGFYWYSEGDGVFDNPNSLTAIYTPGTNDFSSGFVVLKLVAEPCAPCSDPSIDDIELYITQPPTPFQLADASICEGEVYCFDVYVENYSSLEWTGGEGFDDPSSVTPCYTPTTEDFANGFVELCLTLQPVSPCELPVTDCMTLTLFGGQQIIIPQGWSGLSSYIEAVDPDVETVMSAIENEIIVMNDLVGNVFIPSENVNTIGNWNNYAGYTIKLTEEVTLNICGNPVDNRTLNLAEGWNLIPVLSENDVLSSDLFNQIAGKLIIAKEVAGVQLYYPAYQIYTLQSLHSGKAYYVKVSEDCSVIFPVNAGKSELIPEPGLIRNITPWNDVRYAPGTHIFVVPADILSGFATGSVIGAFNGEGFCSGMVEIAETGKTTALIVTGLDNYEKNHTGLAVGENVTFRLYNPATSTVSELLANAENGTAFIANGISVFKSLQISGVSQIEKAQVTIWPNPATDFLKISIEGIQTAYSIELYDSYGSNVLKYNEREGISNIDLSTISRGIYLIKVVYQNSTYTQKVIVQ